jgi:UDP-3-O-[3-hydroxymyristoyl] glucosamine N-acyltransferase
MKVPVREYSLSEIARLCGVTLHGDGSVIIRGVAPITSADKEHITFIESKKRLVNPSLIKAGAVVVPPSLLDETPDVPHSLYPIAQRQPLPESPRFFTEQDYPSLQGCIQQHG